MQQPLISVITPSYNTAQFIERTILSVKNQDYGNVEHIVVDGGSTDSTVDILRRYPHLRWISEPDRGQSHALNKGLRMVQGDIIGWLNSDDTYCPGAFTEVVQFFKTHPDCDVVIGRCNVINEDDEVTGLLHAAPYSPVADVLDHEIPQPSSFMRRRAFEAVGGVDERFAYVMDRDLFLRLGLKFNISAVPSIWANFRICAGTKTASHPERFWLETLDMFDRYFSRADLPTDVRAVESRAKARAYWNAGVLKLASSNPSERQQGANYCRQAFDLFNLLEGDRQFLEQMTTHWAVTKDPADPMSVIQSVLDALYPAGYAGANLRRALISHMAINMFMGFPEQHVTEPHSARKQRIGWLLHAVRLNPHWLSNRGVWSKLARTLVSKA